LETPRLSRATKRIQVGGTITGRRTSSRRSAGPSSIISGRPRGTKPPPENAPAPHQSLAPAPPRAPTHTSRPNWRRRVGGGGGGGFADPSSSPAPRRVLLFRQAATGTERNAERWTGRGAGTGRRPTGEGTSSRGVARFLPVRRGAAFPRGLGARRRSTLGEKYLGPGVRRPRSLSLSLCTALSRLPRAFLPSLSPLRWHHDILLRFSPSWMIRRWRRTDWMVGCRGIFLRL
jgi:hypothetical protein